MEEARGLAAAISLDVVFDIVAPLTAPRPATLLGSGKVADLGEQFKALNVDVAIVDATLSPGQQRNLERAWSVKVLDRTGLILEIFGARAQTKEGRLQVELAHLSYQKSRLVRSWTHLERQRGGGGFTGGPGETQIESDRRDIATRIDRIKKHLKEVRRTRDLQRARRKRAPFPIVALVGYTNAGKSSVFNRLTKASVLAKDMLFATLDPTMRALELPSGRKVILSDTVGFISDLPTHLVEAFRATLEEVLEADIIVHVQDVADPLREQRQADVLSVLEQLGVGEEDTRPCVRLYNKADLLNEDDRDALEIKVRSANWNAGLGLAAPYQCASSAFEEGGLDAFLELIDSISARGCEIYRIALEPQDGSQAAWLRSHGEILDESYFEDGRIQFVIRLSGIASGRYEKKFAEKLGEPLNDGPGEAWPADERNTRHAEH